MIVEFMLVNGYLHKTTGQISFPVFYYTVSFQ